ncbi:hypothetical protein KCP73_25725 [Salmonella enterica subsp. enterica]|nr:hypothetical protein KCP73_25725 [Salmonella enterica subsp. enterica]
MLKRLCTIGCLACCTRHSGHSSAFRRFRHAPKHQFPRRKHCAATGVLLAALLSARAVIGETA